MTVMDVISGVEYFVNSMSYGDHPQGEVVTALSNGGTGLFQDNEIKVRCHCCNEIFTVDADNLK